MISHAIHDSNHDLQLIALSSSRISTSPWCLGASKAQSSPVLHDRTNCCPVSYPVSFKLAHSGPYEPERASGWSFITVPFGRSRSRI